MASATLFTSIVSAQVLGRIEFASTIDFPSIMLQEGTLIRPSVFCQQVNEARPSYLITLEVLANNGSRTVVLPYQAFLETSDAIERMSEDRPLVKGQGKKTYVYKEFEMGWMQIRDTLSWIMIINGTPLITAHFKDYSELWETLQKLDRLIQEYRWGQ
jgi:hypothetical protein